MTGETERPVPASGTTAKRCLVCGSRLSSYNENPTCWTHTLRLPWKGPNTKPK